MVQEEAVVGELVAGGLPAPPDEVLHGQGRAGGRVAGGPPGGPGNVGMAWHGMALH